jgi:hypothetical protein
LRSLVGKIQCLEIPCGIAIPHPAWARNHQAQPPDIPPAEILQVRGRFHAVPTRPVFAPKEQVIVERGEPTPAQAAPMVPLPAPKARQSAPRPVAPQQQIPMQAPPDQQTAGPATDWPAAEALTMSVEVVEAEVGPRIHPAATLPTRPLDTRWRRRPTTR